MNNGRKTIIKIQAILFAVLFAAFAFAGCKNNDNNKKRKVCHLKFFRFVDDCRIAEINVPVIPGIMPVINAAQIRRMVTMCGASFPVRFQKIIHKYEDNKEALFDAGMSYALSQIIDLLVSDIDGIHLYTMNNPLVARKICEGIRHII